MIKDLENRYFRALNKLTKWRTVFVGWQLGTRPIGDPESDALRDHRDCTTILRAEMNAMTALLIAKGVFTRDEFMEQMVVEAGELDKLYEKKFPGFSTTQDGVTIDPTISVKTTKGWRL